MPVLSDPKREKFAQMCARGLATATAYVRAGYKPNTGNAITMRKRPDVMTRIEEIQEQLRASSQQELDEYLSESGLNPAYIVKQVLETANSARSAGKYETALSGYKALGSELFGMFQERKHVAVGNNVNHTTTTVTIQDFSTAFEKLTAGFDGIQIEGNAVELNAPAVLITPEHSKDLQHIDA